MQAAVTILKRLIKIFKVRMQLFFAFLFFIDYDEEVELLKNKSNKGNDG